MSVPISNMGFDTKSSLKIFYKSKISQKFNLAFQMKFTYSQGQAENHKMSLSPRISFKRRRYHQKI